MKSKKIPTIPQNDSFQNEELPEGWTEVPLSKILLTLESGSRPKGGVRGIETGIPSVGGEHLDDRGGFRFENIKYIPMSFFENMRRGRIQTDDILIVKDGATTGKVSLVRSDFPYNPAMVNEHVFVCRFIEGIYSPFIFYFLFSQVGQNRILENFQGSAQGGINQTFAENTVIPVAPYHEQQRIVARVEALLTQVNAARDRLSRVPLIMKRFRQAVLAAACSGRLTEGWREENPTLKHEPCEHVNMEILDDWDIPEEWQWSTISEVCEKIVDCPHSTPKWTPSGKICIRTCEIKPCFLDLSQTRYVSEETYRERIQRLEPKEGDIVFSREGTLGQAAIIPPGLDICLGQRIMQLRTRSGCSPFFLTYLINSPPIQKIVNELTTGSTSPHINVGDVKKFPVPLPPLAEQHEIVRRVGMLFERADAIDREVAAAGRRCERLTQAVLGKAFAGRL